MMYIYKITNTDNGKVYIGKTKDIEQRWRRHQSLARSHKNRRLYDSMNAHGFCAFKIEKVCECSPENVDNMERYYISLYNATNPEFGYNTTSGGEGGDTFSLNPNKEELRKKFLEVHKGFKHSEESKSLMSELAKTRAPMSADTKMKISESLKKFFKDNPEAIAAIRQHSGDGHLLGSGHPMYGKHHTSQAKRKMSDARRGKSYHEIMGAEHAEKLIEMRRCAWIGIKNPNYKDIKPNEIVSALVANKTISDAANSLGISKNVLYSKCRTYFQKTPAEIRSEMM